MENELELLTDDFKIRCIEAVKRNSYKFKTDKSHAINLNINPSQFSRILKGELSNVVSDETFKTIAVRYNVPLHGTAFDYKIAGTKVFNYINEQLDTCQKLSISGMFCDKADIGKSAAAKYYTSTHKNACYIDCSINKSRTKLLRAIAQELGIDYKGPLKELQADVIQYLNVCFTPPIIILEEMGDLEYAAFLEIKALWNGTENKCAWYGMGADGLQKKFDRQLEMKRVGYAEVFRRFGSRYQCILPTEDNERKLFLIDEIKRILQVNPSKLSPLEMYAKTGGSLTRVYIEIKKERLGITSGKTDKMSA